MARRVAEEMGMGSVGKHHGIVLAAQRIKRKAAGEKVVFRIFGFIFLWLVGFKFCC